MAGPAISIQANGSSAAAAAAENGHGGPPVGLEDVHGASVANGNVHEELQSNVSVHTRQADEDSLHESLSEANVHQFIRNITTPDDFTTPPTPPPALTVPIRAGSVESMDAELHGHLDHRESRIYDDFKQDPSKAQGGHVEDAQAKVIDEVMENDEPEEAQSRKSTRSSDVDGDYVQTGDRLFRLPITEAETATLQKEALATEIARHWARFDSFFGIFLVGNGILVGIQTDRRDALAESQWFVIENAFLFIFIIELGLRFARAGWRKMLKEGWCYFDIFIISVSIVDVLYFSTLSGAQAEALAPLLRGIRLFRLARLIRLFRLLKELWMLVQCLLMTFKLLFWAALLLAIVLYICGIVMREMVSPNPDLSEEARQRYRNVPSSMFFLLQMSTFDGWHDLVNEITSVMPVMYMFFMLFLCIAGFGIMNLIVGIMSYSAIEVRKSDRNLTRITTAVRRHKALLEIRASLLQKQPGMFGYKMLWVPKAILAELRMDPFSSACLKEAGLSMGTVSNIVDAMIVDHEQPHGIHVDFFIKSLTELNGDMVVRALDLLTILTQFRRISTDFHDSANVFCKSLQYMHACLQRSKAWSVRDHDEQMLELAKLLFKLNIKGRELGIESFWPLPALADGEQPKLPLPHGLKSLPSNSRATDGDGGGDDDDNNVEAMAEKVFGRFDVFFGMFVIGNGVLIGFQSNDLKASTDNALTWRILDACFCFIFTVELIFRLLLYNQVYEEMDMRLWGMIVPEGVFQKTRLQCVLICVNTLPKFLKNPLQAFDAAIVMLSLVDNLVIAWLDTGMDMSFLLVIRFVRLLKVARITRTFKLCGELYLLVEGVVNSMRTLWWTIVLLIILLYIMGIIMVELVGKSTNDPDLKFRWDTVDRCMFTLAQIATLDGWGELVWQLSHDHPELLMVLLVFIMFASMGIMNIIVGIMCESAVSVTEQLSAKAEKVKQKAAGDAIAEVRRYLTTRVSEDAVHISRSQIHEALLDSKIEKLCRKARVVPEDVRTIFDRLHGMTKKPDDLVIIDELLHACLQFHQQLAISDVVSLKLYSGTVMMRCRERCAMLRSFSDVMVKTAQLMDEGGTKKIQREEVHSLSELQVYLQQQDEEQAPESILKSFKEQSDKEADRIWNLAKMAAPQLRHH